MDSGEGMPVNADLMKFIDAIQHQQDSQGILRIMQEAIGHYGFTSFIISGLPEDDLDPEAAILLSGWNAEWYKRYTSLNYAQHDPVARNCYVTSLPFEWAEVHYDAEADPMAHRVMEEARAHGMENGLCVPIHIEGQLQGVVSFAGDPKRLDERQRLEVHMLSLYAYGQLRFLSRLAERQGERPTLTRRESEVLGWVAAGKTAGEIATITGMTARTVNQHCENAQKRLGTSNRVHTVVEAIRLKLISL